MMTRRQLLTGSAGALALGATGLVPHGVAQAGVRTARILVGFPPGGTTDVIARLLAGAMKDYASAIIVENRSGGAGRFAIEALKSAPCDGSVFLLAPLATMTLYPHVYRTLRYAAIRSASRLHSGKYRRRGLISSDHRFEGAHQREDTRRLRRLVPGQS
jgi:tripartite-type tricarboxylate transporter receptor subunit TctC